MVEEILGITPKKWQTPWPMPWLPSCEEKPSKTNKYSTILPKTDNTAESLSIS